MNTWSFASTENTQLVLQNHPQLIPLVPLPALGMASSQGLLPLLVSRLEQLVLVWGQGQALRQLVRWAFPTQQVQPSREVLELVLPLFPQQQHEVSVVLALPLS